MGVETLLLAATVGSQIFSGIESGKAQREQGRLLEKQSAIVKEEAERESEIILEETERIQGEQVAAFGASGVTLTGSPLDVLERTRVIGMEEASAVLRSGIAHSELLTQQSRILRNQARADVIGGIAGGAQTTLAFGDRLNLF
jgi:hypothetical protein